MVYSCVIMLVFLFFFFQAEDGIRDYKVTGVQTCALPIYLVQLAQRSNLALVNAILNSVRTDLVEYLAGVQDVAPHRPVAQELPVRLAATIVAAMRDSSAARIKVYNRRGVVVFSTKSN